MCPFNKKYLCNKPLKSCLLHKPDKEIEHITAKIQKSASILYDEKLQIVTEKLDEKMDSIGFKFNGNGSTRRAYASPDGKYIVKFQVQYFDSKDGYNQNKNEITNFDTIPDNAKMFYNAPIAWDKNNFTWILFRKAKTYDRGLTYEACQEIIHKIKSNLIPMGIEVGLNDIASSNIGEVDGKPVLIDYGYGTFS